ncbi:hypothetical protein Tco_0428810 [Tanacetum coccineum]
MSIDGEYTKIVVVYFAMDINNSPKIVVILLGEFGFRNDKWGFHKASLASLDVYRRSSPSRICLSDSDNELVIPTPWSDEAKNEKRAKSFKEEFKLKKLLFEIDYEFDIDFELENDIEVMKENLSQEKVCEEKVSIDNIEKLRQDLVEMPSEVVK